MHGAIVGLAIHADRLGVRDALRSAVQEAPAPAAKRWRECALLALDDDYRAAADNFASAGGSTFEAEFRLAAGEHLIARGRRAEGEVELRKALEYFGQVGATAWARDARELLAKIAYSDSA
jgi:hypothetical protein